MAVPDAHEPLATEAPNAPPHGEGVALRLLRLGILVVFFLILVTPTIVDPDLWGHVLYGRDIVSAKALEDKDPYSFTSDRPWINHEWLAEVTMYIAYDAGGPAGLIGLKALTVALIVGCILISLRRHAGSVLTHDLLVLLALVGMFPRYHPVRPQMFSLLLFSILLLLLQRAERGERQRLVVVPLVFAAWSNLHGGFLVGLAVLAVWAAVSMISTPSRWLSLTVLALSSVVATLVTPYGPGLWLFLWETVGLSRTAINDWRPALMSPPIVLAPWLAVLSTAGLAVWRGRRGGISAQSIAIVVMLGVASARVGRLDAFFALSVVMLLGSVLGSTRVPDPRSKLGMAWPAWAVATTIAIVSVGLYGFYRQSSCISMRDYPEPAAVAFLEKRNGRLLTYFNWGQYAIWHLAPSLKVSIDGRRETVYSEDLMTKHLRLYRGDAEGVQFVANLAPGLIWLPTTSPAIAPLEKEGWSVSFRGPVSVVLMQQPTESPVTVAGAPPTLRCFPSR